MYCELIKPILIIIIIHVNHSLPCWLSCHIINIEILHHHFRFQTAFSHSGLRFQRQLRHPAQPLTSGGHVTCANRVFKNILIETYNRTNDNLIATQSCDNPRPRIQLAVYFRISSSVHHAFLVMPFVYFAHPCTARSSFLHVSVASWMTPFSTSPSVNHPAQTLVCNSGSLSIFHSHIRCAHVAWASPCLMAQSHFSSFALCTTVQPIIRRNILQKIRFGWEY